MSWHSMKKTGEHTDRLMSLMKSKPSVNCACAILLMDGVGYLLLLVISR